ncbi:hypothetical protein [Brevundimonas nasdae]|uniref:hypothetical protein n=1 Tax=Brevundimonas nasdae TaxID=172043 RepID=UPI00301B46AC
MIRYGPNTTAELQALVDAHDAGWAAEAAQRTTDLIAAGSYSEQASIWGAIKPVFMALQREKCIFCERGLGSILTGSGEHDVEHFRPKGRVRAWPYPSRKPKVSYAFATGTANATGYYWLAYDIDNYAAACKSCNSNRKGTYFPVFGTRGSATAGIGALNGSEQPALLFPRGPHGDDPNDFILFKGILAVPRHASGVKHRRAQVTIDFFSLNVRPELLKDRARTIREIFFASEVAANSQVPALADAARRTISEVVWEGAPQAACARAYVEVINTNKQLAWDYFCEAERMVKTLRT